MSSPIREDTVPRSPMSDSSPRMQYGGSSPVAGSSPRSSMSQSSVPRTPSSSLGLPFPFTSPRRGDVGSRVRVRDTGAPGEMKEPSSPSSSISSSSNALLSVAQVWGTDVNTDSATQAFDKFWNEFIDANTGEPLYPRLLEEAVMTSTYNINLNCNNLYAFDPNLYKQLVTYPQELIPLFDLYINAKRTQMNPDYEEDQRIQVRPFNLKQSCNMRELNPEDIDSLIAVKGMVIRCGGIIPEMKMAFFQCNNCQNTARVVIEDGQIAEPSKCSHCDEKYVMELIHNRCAFADKQMVKVQETPDSIPEGETPHTITVYAYDDLVDIAKPGDKVEITGVYRADPIRTNSRQRTMQTVFRPYLDAIHFKKSDSNRLQAEDSHASREDEAFTSFEESDITNQVREEREIALRELGQRADIYDLLTRSVAPHIWEMDDVKKGILCMLFGGSNNELGAGHGRFRGEINVLMCGDPGTSKSQLLQYVHRIAPRGLYTSGKGSSAVGLTASISKDPDSGELVLESGALVLSDRGVCCIDEFDKMSDSTRSILHEVMEQQTVSIAKAGIVCTLNARTSILASANPKESRYNPNLSVVQNIQLMPTLLSRFDLIYLVLDQPNELRDRKLARHLVSLYHENPESKVQAHNLIPMETLTQYITFARRAVTPVLTEEAMDLLINGYVEMRKIGQTGQRKVITATPRQLESLIRLSEALARMRLSELVEKADVQEARRLMNVATQTAATDPRTGKIDMDLLSIGSSSSDRKKLEQQAAAVKDLLAARSAKASSVSALHKAFNESLNAKELEVSAGDFRKILEVLEEEGVINISKGRQGESVRALEL